MKNLLSKLLEEKDDSKIFSLITTTSKNESIFWDDILKTFQSFLPHKSINKKYFWGNDLKILNQFGFDIDFEDSFGHTLLFYLFSQNNKNHFLSFEIKDILKNTKKLYHITHTNENILFLMAKNLNNLDWKATNDYISGQNLIDFIEKHPDLNIQQHNKLNRNLINQLILGNVFPIKLFDYLVENGLSINHIDNDGYNLLNFFPLVHFRKEISSRFLMLCQHNDITNENKYHDSCISSLISFVSDKNQNSNQKTYIQWLTFIFEKIIEGEIPVFNKEKLISILNVDTKNYSFEAKEIIPLQQKTIGFLKYQTLNEKFPEKHISQKKIKI